MRERDRERERERERVTERMSDDELPKLKSLDRPGKKKETTWRLW